ncbi:MAG: hypothetical protein U5L96_10190 [Owenweeksia sp.]|nr:hypothetical protein [Owenweeksia sp.]
MNWSDLINKTAEQRKSLREFREQQKKAKGIESCIPVLESMIEISAEGKKLSSQKKELFDGERHRENMR